MMELNWLRDTPIAHRGYHNKAEGRVENSLSAVKAAIEKSFSIEVDLQFTKNKIPVVFHDFTLERLTKKLGNTRDRTSEELSQTQLKGSNDSIPHLEELIDLVGGKVGLVLELKGMSGMDEGYVNSVLQALENYNGPLAIMSFNHWLLEDARKLNCKFPLGLVAEGDDSFYDRHKQITNELNLDFISYDIGGLPCKFVTEFKQTGKPVICWTVRDEETLRHAAIYTDQITFEGFDPT